MHFCQLGIKEMTAMYFAANLKFARTTTKVVIERLGNTVC